MTCTCNLEYKQDREKYQPHKNRNLADVCCAIGTDAFLVNLQIFCCRRSIQMSIALTAGISSHDDTDFLLWSVINSSESVKNARRNKTPNKFV